MKSDPHIQKKKTKKQCKKTTNWKNEVWPSYTEEAENKQTDVKKNPIEKMKSDPRIQKKKKKTNPKKNPPIEKNEVWPSHTEEEEEENKETMQKKPMQLKKEKNEVWPPVARLWWFVAVKSQCSAEATSKQVLINN